jgi:hypothetical protein
MGNNAEPNPWAPWVSWSFPGTFAHPGYPAGGTGPGYARCPGPSGTGFASGRAPDPFSPAGRAVQPWEAAAEYAKFELDRARENIGRAVTWDALRSVAFQALGPKSFGLGACYGMVKNPAMSVVGLVQLQRMLIEADLYERLTHRVSWKMMLTPGCVLGLPQLYEVGFNLMRFAGVINIDDLKRSYEAREALIKNVEEMIDHPVDALGKMTDQMKASYLAKWNRFRELMKQPDLKSQFEAGEIFGDVLMEVVMLVLTAISVAGAAAKLAAKVPQLVRLANLIKGARAAEAGGAAAEAAEGVKGSGVAKAVTTAERAPARNWQYAAKQTGRTEPGAVPKTPEYEAAMKQAESRTAPPAPDGWPQMSDRTATTFGSEPRPVEYPPGTKLYRVIDSDKSASGSFWSTEPPPSTEGAWRGSAAVKDPWNGDGGYVQHQVGPEGLKAWAGSAAPQEAATTGSVLPGGAQQAWVPPNSITPVNPPQPTPWNLTASK